MKRLFTRVNRAIDPLLARADAYAYRHPTRVLAIAVLIVLVVGLLATTLGIAFESPLVSPAEIGQRRT